MRTKSIRLTLIGCCILFSQSAVALVININSPVGFDPNALLAFERAATQWETRIFDPITITINTNFVNLGDPDVIGNASSVQLTYTGGDSYTAIRDLMVADAANETDDAIVAYLPTSGELQVVAPVGFNVDGMAASKANLKALGVADLDAIFGAGDGEINFNTEFSFDFDNSDGVGADMIDFETVAAHEIGHILGFTSAVDLIAASTSGDVRMRPLDLFRFQDGADPTTMAEFTTAPRSLVPGGDPIFDDILNEILLSDGLSNQASHWADDLDIGIMDPTLGYGEISLLSELDLRALDLIGYEITTVPIPATVWLFGSGLIGLAYSSRTKRKV